MKLTYNNKDINLYECKTFFKRLKGFMFAQKIDKALLFNHCNSIHTFFMKQNIDVIMCNQNNEIIHYYRDLPKRKIIMPKKYVQKVIETPSKYFNIKIGDKVIISEN